MMRLCYGTTEIVIIIIVIIINGHTAKYCSKKQKLLLGIFMHDDYGDQRHKKRLHLQPPQLVLQLKLEIKIIKKTIISFTTQLKRNLFHDPSEQIDILETNKAIYNLVG